MGEQRCRTHAGSVSSISAGRDAEMFVFSFFPPVFGGVVAVDPLYLWFKKNHLSTPTLFGPDFQTFI